MKKNILVLLSISIAMISCGKKGANSPSAENRSSQLEGGIEISDLNQTLKYKINEDGKALDVALEVTTADGCRRYHNLFKKSEIDLKSKDDPVSYGNNEVRMIWKTTDSSNALIEQFEMQNQLIKYRHFLINDNFKSSVACELQNVQITYQTTSEVVSSYLENSKLTVEVLKDSSYSQYLAPSLDLGSTRFSIKLSDDYRLIVKLSKNEMQIVGLSNLSPNIQSVLEYIKHQSEPDVGLETISSIPLLILNEDVIANSERSFCANPRLSNYLNYLDKTDEDQVRQKIINILKTCQQNYEERNNKNE